MQLEVMFTLKKSVLISLVPSPLWRAAECDVRRLALSPKPHTGCPARDKRD